jgi:MFS transporter, FHS family, glucose/mannose:H+ symporter
MTKWPYIFLAYLTLFSLSIIDNSRGPAYPDILTYFSIGSTRGSFLFAIATASGLISSITAKWWLKKFSLTQSCAFSLLILSLGSLSFGLSAKFGLYILDLASVLIGIGMGCSNICMNLLISRGTSDKHRRQFFSGLHSVYGIGSFLAPLLLSFSYSLHRSWFEFFIIISLIPLMTFFWSLRLEKSEIANEEILAHPLPVITAIPFKERFVIGTIFAFYVSCEVMISSRLVYFLEFGHNLPLSSARWALSCFFALLLLGRFLFTVIPFKGDGHLWLKASCISTLVIITISLIYNPLWLVFSGLSMSFFYPVGMEWLSKNYSNHLDQLMPSILTFVSIGLVVMHLLFGIFTDYFGINNAFLIAYILQVGTLSLLLLYRQIYSKAK